MNGREELTAESEALLRHLAAQGYVMLAPVMDDLRAIEAAAEERAVARHVRETGCDGLTVERLAVAMCETGHPLSPLTGDSIPCGWHLLRADALRAALAPTVAASDVSCIHLPGHPDDCEECDCTPSPATEAERRGGGG